MSLRDQAIGLFVFFPVLTTITVGLRIFVRTKINKGAFGMDDVALVITYIGILLWVAFASTALQYPFGSEGWKKYDSAKADVCYIISGTVKISVALVLYRLDSRLLIRVILIADMIICSLWTIVVTLIIGLGCSSNSPMTLSVNVCQASNYAQEISYVLFDVLHVIIPIVILWNVQISKTMKWNIVALFGVGLLAAIAAIMKLQVYVEMYNSDASADYETFAYRSLIWAITEHGLSLFAASVLALRPILSFISESWTTLSDTLYSGTSKSGSSRPLSSRVSKTMDWKVSHESTELDTVGLRDDVDEKLENPDRATYTVNIGSESQTQFV